MEYFQHEKDLGSYKWTYSSRKEKMKKIPALQEESSGRLIYNQKELPSILNKHFASCGAALAAKLPHLERHF